MKRSEGCWVKRGDGWIEDVWTEDDCGKREGKGNARGNLGYEIDFRMETLTLFE